MGRRLLVGACVAAALVVVVLWWRAGRGDDHARATGGRDAATTLAPRLPRVPAKPASLAGRVTRASDGASVAGAVVMLAGQHPSWAERAAPVVATTDGDGRWRAGAVAPGSYTLTVAAAGFLPHSRDLTPTAAGEERIGVDVSLAAGGGLVAGTITTEDRAPVANARVRAYRNRDQPSFVAISDGAGRYQLGLSPGSYQLEVTHDDHRTAWKNVRAADEPTTADLVLVRGGVVRGVVVAGDLGEPVPYAIVTTGGSTADAGADGSFELRGLPDGRVLIGARARGYASATPTTVVLGVGQEVDDVRVTVDPALAISGRVVAASDPTRGIEGAAVLARPVDHERQDASAISDADGGFELVGMLPGLHSLDAQKRGMLVDRGQEVVVADADVTDVIVALRTGLTLSGRVHPPQVAQVALSQPKHDVLDPDFTSVERARTHSDAIGEFVLREVPPGDFELTGMGTDGSSGKLAITMTDADRTGLVIQLTPRPSVSGHVLDTAGKPVAGAYVGAYRVDVPPMQRLQRDGILRLATTGPDGAFVIVGLDPQRWEIRAGGPRGTTSKVPRTEVDLADGVSRTGVVVTVEAREAEIRGVVLGPDGKPIAGAKVRATRQESYGETVTTDAAGAFAIDRLLPGTYTVVAEAPRDGATALARDVRTGEPVTLVVARLSSLAVTVTRRGAPTAGVHVSCQGPPGTYVDEELDDSTHTFEDVAQGEWECGARSDAGSARAKVVVGAQRARLALALADHGALTGTLVDVLTGQPVGGLLVAASGSGADTDARGHFVVEQVEAGTGKVRISPRDNLGVGYDLYPYTVQPGQRVDLGRLEVVPPRKGDAGTFGLTVDVRADALVVTAVRPGSPAARAGLAVGASITAIEGKAVAAIGLERAQRLLTSASVGTGRVFTLTFRGGERATLTAVAR